MAIFHAEVLAEVETTVDDITYNDAEGQVIYYWNEGPVSDYQPREVWFDGNHMMHLLYYFNLQNTQVNDFDVRLKMSGGSVFIKQMHIKSAIYGQNLYATDKFDGIIKIEEDFSEMAQGVVSDITAEIALSEAISSGVFPRIYDGYSDDMSNVIKILEAITVTGMSADSVEVDTE